MHPVNDESGSQIWKQLYEAAVLETDNAKLSAKINAAEAAIQKRYESQELDRAEIQCP
jgi:hypothetical protein